MPKSRPVLALTSSCLLALAPLVLATPAQAAVGVVLGHGLSYDKYIACQNAMTDAHAKATIDAMAAPGGAGNLHIVSTDCQCEETPSNEASIRWSCMAVTHWSNE